MSIITAILSFIFSLISKTTEKRRPVDMEGEPERASQYPPPYPNGWYNLCSSESLKKGEVKEIVAFAKRFAVYRGESGQVAAFDIYCPHLSANLADGWVKGDELVCPFHGWQFKQDGKCSHIPYSEHEPPAKAKTTSYHVVENWGLILMWYHADDQLPEWTTDKYLQEMSDYKYHGHTSDVLHIHLQDFAENGADYAHFNFVHNLLTIPFSKNFVHMTHDIEINFGEGEEKHLAWFSDQANLAWNKSGKKIDKAGGSAVVSYYGPGFLVFKMNSRLAKDVLIIKSFTPIGPLKLRMDDYVYAPKGTNRFALKYVIRESAAQFHDDIVLWERKGFARNPILVKGDGPIMKMRHWYKQFYKGSEQHSIDSINLPVDSMEEVAISS